MKSSHSYNRYVDLSYKANFQKEVIAKYHVKKSHHSKLEGFAFLGAIAAESSTGTWVEVKTDKKASVAVSGKVFYYDPEDHICLIAYPSELFEPGNVSQLLTVIAGNAFGLADVSELKLLDVSIPPSLVEAFAGPALGTTGIYDLLGKPASAPIVGAIIKPKCGLIAQDHASICFDAWSGMAGQGGSHGVDMVKDDEALTHQVAFGSAFYERFNLTMDALRRAEDLTGKKKVYVPNITHSDVFESLRRAQYVKDHGGDAVMIDYVIGGCSLLHTIRNANLGLIIHGHRTLFAALHRPADFGVDYMVFAKLFRIIGGDQMHTGTPAVGVMKADQRAVKRIVQAMRADVYDDPDQLPQDFCGRKAVAPICGAGLDPLTTKAIADTLGPELIIFAGGGCHGHPDGTAAGGAALQESASAYEDGIDLVDWANSRNRDYLSNAVRFFGSFDKQSPNDSARVNM